MARWLKEPQSWRQSKAPLSRNTPASALTAIKPKIGVFGF
jgi:hypothetical protein